MSTKSDQPNEDLNPSAKKRRKPSPGEDEDSNPEEVTTNTTTQDQPNAISTDNSAMDLSAEATATKSQQIITTSRSQKDDQNGQHTSLSPVLVEKSAEKTEKPSAKSPKISTSTVQTAVDLGKKSDDNSGKVIENGRPHEDEDTIYKKKAEQLLKKQLCYVCEKDVTRMYRVLNADVTQREIIVCLECFCMGKEKSPHQATCDYYVIDNMRYPLFNKQWSAYEELLLLEGLEKYGYGNWSDISEHVMTKSKNRCEAHYNAAFLGSETAPMPDIPNCLTIIDPEDGSLKFNSEYAQRQTEKELEVMKEVEEKNSVDNNNKNQGAVSERTTRSASNTANHSKKDGAVANAAEIVGYMPLRGDFEIEYDNDAELILADMEFNDDDDPADVELKLKVLDIYNMKLDERERRKKFVVERGLLDLKKQSMNDRRRTKEEREIFNHMKVFARFNTPEDHEKLVAGLIHQRHLCRRIEELKYFRDIGLKTFAEVSQYLEDKRKRDSDISTKKQKDNDAYQYEINKLISSSSQRRNRWLNRDKTEENKAAAVNATEFSKLEGANLLSEKEQDLCIQQDISPAQYIVIKEALCRDTEKLGGVSKSYAEKMSELEKSTTGHIFDFLVTNNVIQEASSKKK